MKYCNKCGKEFNEKVDFCPNCGQKTSEVISINIDNNITNDTNNSVINNIANPGSKVEINIVNNDETNAISSSDNMSNNVEKKKILSKKTLLFLVIIIILIIVSIFFIRKLTERQRNASSLGSVKEQNLKFKLDGDEYILGERLGKKKEKGLLYDEKNKSINTLDFDTIGLQSFSHNKKLFFNGVYYCNKEDGCDLDDNILIKLNFDSRCNVLIDDFIKFGLKYDEVVEKYGKESGVYYQDEDYLVWASDSTGKVGSYYFILQFKSNDFFSTNGVSSIKIGVWWYDGEYDRTVVNIVQSGDNNEG